MPRPRVLFLGLFLGAVAIVIILNWYSKIKADPPRRETVLKVSVPAGATFSDLSRWLGIAAGTANAILESAKGKYDLAAIVSGRDLALVYDAFNGGLRGLVYEIDTERELIATADEEDGWLTEVASINYEIQEKEASGAINESLYKTMTEQGLDDRLVLALAETFAWQVDFAADIRAGDSFKVIYEERYRDGQYAMPGKILAARFTNDGEVFQGFYFPGSAKTRAGLPAEVSTKAGHYDQEGKALQKIFLKSPLQYKYISSGFSYARVNPITRKVSPHRGIDYAAPAGTPAVAVGDGTVIQAGWNGYYGISATIRHNDTYRTVYGHFSSLAKGIKIGAKVKQGQVVGYVGSTGQATGPHLHYEMHKFTAYVNPFKVEVPPGEPISEEDLAAFRQIVDKYAGKL